MPAFDELIEVIVYAEDIDRLTAFYTDVLGLDMAEGDPEHGFVRFDTGGCDLCLHAGREEAPGRFAPKITFSVEDLTAAREHLSDHGVELGEIRNPAPGVRVFDGQDPEGNSFSVEEQVS